VCRITTTPPPSLGSWTATQANECAKCTRWAYSQIGPRPERIKPSCSRPWSSAGRIISANCSWRRRPSGATSVNVATVAPSSRWHCHLNGSRWPVSGRLRMWMLPVTAPSRVEIPVAAGSETLPDRQECAAPPRYPSGYRVHTHFGLA